MHITHTALISKIVAVQEEKDEKSINTTDMTKKKLAYEAPKTESQELRFEGALLTGSVKANAIQSLSYDDEDPLSF